MLIDLKAIEKKLDVTAQYPLPKEINVDKVNTIYIDNLNDVVPHIINNNTKEKIVFIFDGEFDDLVIEMVQAKYIPDIICKNSSIKGFKFKLKDVEYMIQHSDMSAFIVHNIEEDELQLYNKCNNDINKWLINKNFISKFNEETRKALEDYSLRPLTASFEYTSEELLSIDFNKAYTSCLYGMEYIPTFNVFDKFIDYDGHKIEDYTYYLVEFQDDNIEMNILTSKKTCIIFGYIISRSGLNYKIIKYIRPSNIYIQKEK